jgi:hypothetical protein
LNQHLADIHKYHYCGFCKLKFNTALDLRFHIRTHPTSHSRPWCRSCAKLVFDKIEEPPTQETYYSFDIPANVDQGTPIPVLLKNHQQQQPQQQQQQPTTEQQLILEVMERLVSQIRVFPFNIVQLYL